MFQLSILENIAKQTVFERLEDFLDNATVGIHLVNSDGIILYANKAEMELMGYSAEEYIGHSIKEFHANQPAIESILSTLLSNQQLINHEAKLRCKDDSIKEVLISSNVYSVDGKFQHTRCFTRDITKLKKVEKLLRYLNSASEELTITHDIQVALDKILKFIIPDYTDWFTIDILNDDGKTELIKMAHADPDKINWAEKYRITNPIDLNDETPGSLGWVLRTGEAVLASEITNEMIEAAAKDEEHLKVLKMLSIKSAMIIPMLSKGKIMGVVRFVSCNPLRAYDKDDFNFAKDFTNRIALTLENTRLYEEVTKDIQQKIEANKIKDQFINIASHELRTPVTSLKAYAQMLYMTFEDSNPNAAKMLLKMNTQIDKLTGLIVDMLDITKIDNGEILFNIEEFDFNELVKEIAEEMQRTTATHIVKVELNKCGKINGDKNRIGQVVNNFVSNAIKYSPNANEIVVTTEGNEESVKLGVKDFGIGICKSNQAKIFTRFYKVAGSNHEDTFPGLGLGLYISAEIIKRHSGTINFESIEGKGSTFYFYLPRLKL
ncbi:MAG: ATP-binding protein [Ginsengibacter sp.]